MRRYQAITGLGIMLFCLMLFRPAQSISQEQEGAEGSHGVQAPSENKITLTLDDAINLALRVNRNIVSEGYNVVNQHLGYQSAKSAFDLKVYPATNVGANGGTSNLTQTGFGMSFNKKFESGNQLEVKPNVAYSSSSQFTQVTTGSGLSLTVPLFRGAGKEVNLDGVRSAQFSIRSEERNDYLIRVGVILDTITTVYEMARQKEFQRLSESLAEKLRADAALARAKEKISLASPMDIYRVEINLKNAEADAATAGKSHRDAQRRLKTVLVLPVEKEIEVATPLNMVMENISREKALETAFGNRVEAQQAEDALVEAERKAEVARRNAKPELNMIMNYSRYGTGGSFEQSTGFEQSSWSVSLASSTDLARVAERLAYQTSLNNVESARSALEGRREQIAQEVINQYETLARLEEAAGIRNAQIKKAEAKLALAELKFNNGLANNFDVVEAELELQRARMDLFSARVDYIVGTYGFRASLGTLMEHSGAKS